MTKESIRDRAGSDSSENWVTMGDIVVIGGGGHAKVVLSILSKLRTYRIVGYTDLRDCGTLLGVPYLGSDTALESLAATSGTLNAVLAVGQIGLGHARSELWGRLRSLSMQFPLITSPGAIVNEGVSSGEGSVVMDGAVVNVGAKLGQGAIVNTNSTVEHDVALGDWVHVAPGATICGGVTVGHFSTIGAGATVIEGIEIAADCIVGAGATVVRDIKEAGTYAGCPAHKIK